MSRRPSKMENKTAYTDFLTDFCEEHHGPVKAEDKLPFRLNKYLISKDEIEGEALDVTLEYLTLPSRRCPPLLAATIARRVADKTMALDIKPFIYKSEDDDDTNAEKGKAESPEDETKKEEEEEQFESVLLDFEKFIRQIYTFVHEVCAEFKAKVPDINPPKRMLKTSSHAIRNTRRRMEDKHVLLPYLNSIFSMDKEQPEQSYYAVFDGHVGQEAACFAAANLHGNIVHNKAFKNDIPQAMKEGFKRTDNQFVAKSKRENMRSGSTGVCTLLSGNKLHVAWLGDSQAMLVKEGRPEQLMVPHKPERQDEKERIEALGGCVVWFGAWRVNGTLSVSRAIGDAEHKPYVSGEAEVKTVELDGKEDYIILACDGMWDTVSPNDVVIQVHEYLKTNKHEGVAEKLVELAREKGSNDNITVVVVFLRDKVAKPDIVASARSSCTIPTEDRRSSNVDPESASRSKDEKHEQEPNVDQENKSKDSNGSGSNTRKAAKEKDDSTVVVVSSIEADGSKELILAMEREASSSKESSKNINGNGTHSSASQKPNLSSGQELDSEDISNNASGANSEAVSETSGTDVALMSKTATRCLANRRSKQGRRRRSSHNSSNGKGDKRRNIKEKSSPVSWKTPMASPRVKSASFTFTQTQKNMIKSGDQIFEMLTGYSPLVMRKRSTPQCNRWTVAVECDSTVFGEKEPVLPAVEKPRKQSRSSSFISSLMSSTLASPVD